jgi:site-specific DNA recombinase
MRAAVYVRVSTSEQVNEGFSIPAQRDRLTAYAQSQDWDITGFYIEEGLSAKNMERPELQRMLKDIMGGKIDIVLVYKLDRLTRSVLDLHKLLETFEKYNCKFKSATEVYDTASALGRMFITLVGALAQFEREQLAERVKMGMTQKVKSGEWHGGPVPFGYEYKDGSLHIVESEARIVRMVFDWYLSGKGLWTIAKSLNQLGYKKSGVDWYSFTVGYVLQNPVCIGTLRLNDMEVPNAAPPIIDHETFDQVQKTIAMRKSKHPRQATSDYIFSGALRCARCGSALIGKLSKQRNTWRYYICGGRKKGVCTLPFLEEGLLEGSFLSMLNERIQTIRYEIRKAAEEVAAANEKEKDQSGRILSIKREIKLLQEKRKKMQLLAIDELIAETELKEFLRENRQLEEELQRDLDQLEGGSQTIDQLEFAGILEEFSENWHLLSNQEKKTSLQFLVEGIHVNAPYDTVPRDRKKQVVEVKDIRFK